MNDLVRLVYCSENLTYLKSNDYKEVGKILAVSRKNNSKSEITGALVFNAGFFAQILEGPEVAVSETFERIQFDPRHKKVVLLDLRKIETRSFGEWSMGYWGRDVLSIEVAKQIECYPKSEDSGLLADALYLDLVRIADQYEAKRLERLEMEDEDSLP